MLAQVQLIRVFVASPGDVVDEREALVGVIAELNRTIAREKGARLELVRWETDATPGFGADAQDVINRQIGPVEIFIGIFWNRIGTATHRAESGSVEEFERAHTSFEATGLPHILLYFRDPASGAASDGGDEAQRKAVLSFRERVEKGGAFYRRYGDVAAFVPMIREHLANETHAMLRAAAEEASGPSSLVSSRPSVVLNEEEERICELYSACRNLVRVADDLNTCSEHYLAMQPETPAAFARQVSDMTDAVGMYNEAWNRVYRQRADFEDTVRDLNRRGLDEVHELAAAVLSQALDFQRGYTPPEAATDGQFQKQFKRLDAEWRQNRIELGSSLSQAREAIDLLEDYLEKLGRRQGEQKPRPNPKAAWDAIGLLADYRDQASGFAGSIGSFLATDFDVPADVVKAAWAMAPWVESMNKAYAALEERSMPLRLSVLRSGPAFSRYDRLAGLIRRAEKYQWHEVRPLHNALLGTLISVVQGDTEPESLEQLRRQAGKWRELIEVLEHGSKLFDLSGAFPEE